MSIQQEAGRWLDTSSIRTSTGVGTPTSSRAITPIAHPAESVDRPSVSTVSRSEWTRSATARTGTRIFSYRFDEAPRAGARIQKSIIVDGLSFHRPKSTTIHRWSSACFETPWTRFWRNGGTRIHETPRSPDDDGYPRTRRRRWKTTHDRAGTTSRAAVVDRSWRMGCWGPVRHSLVVGPSLARSG